MAGRVTWTWFVDAAEHLFPFIRATLSMIRDTAGLALERPVGAPGASVRVASRGVPWLGAGPIAWTQTVDVAERLSPFIRATLSAIRGGTSSGRGHFLAATEVTGGPAGLGGGALGDTQGNLRGGPLPRGAGRGAMRNCMRLDGTVRLTSRLYG